MEKEKKELLESIFNLMSNKEKNIFYQLDDDNIHFLREINKFHKNIDLIMKAKGVLKKEKLKKKALKKLKESSKEIYMTVNPSKETYVFHLLLDCILRISYLLNYKSKILGENESLSFSNENIESLEIEFTERILKRSKSIDTRSSNFLKSIIKYNDMVINNSLLEKEIDNFKDTVTLKTDIEIKNLCKEYDFLKEIMKSAILGSTCMDELEFKYNKKEIKEFKYNFSRIQTFAQDIKKELNVFDILFNCGEYKELVLKSFLDSNEKMTHESVKSYLKYLIWIDQKGKLDEEYKLIS